VALRSNTGSYSTSATATPHPTNAQKRAFVGTRSDARGYLGKVASVNLKARSPVSSWNDLRQPLSISIFSEG